MDSAEDPGGNFFIGKRWDVLNGNFITAAIGEISIGIIISHIIGYVVQSANEGTKMTLSILRRGGHGV